MMMVAISEGCHLVVMPRFDPEATLAEIEKRRATWVYVVPTMMNRIWRLPDGSAGKYERLLHRARSGTSPRPARQPEGGLPSAGSGRRR